MRLIRHGVRPDVPWPADDRAVASVPLGLVQLRLHVSEDGWHAALLGAASAERARGACRRVSIALHEWERSADVRHDDIDLDQRRRDLVELVVVIDDADPSEAAVAGPSFLYGAPHSTAQHAASHRDLVRLAAQYAAEVAA